MTEITKNALKLPPMVQIYAQAALKPNRAHTFKPFSAALNGFQIKPKKYAKFLRFFKHTPADRTLLFAPYLQVMTQASMLWFMTRPRFPFKPMGLVHMSMSFEQTGTLTVNDTYNLTMTLGQLTECKSGGLFDITSVFECRGNVVMTITNTFLNRAIRTKNANPIQDIAEFRSVDAFDNPPENIHYPSNIGRKYGLLSSDINPIHLTALSAKILGFKRAIAHGMYNVCALYSKADGGQIDLYQPHRSAFQFKTPIFLPGSAKLFEQSSHNTDQIIKDMAIASNSRPHLLAQFTTSI